MTLLTVLCVSVLHNTGPYDVTVTCSVCLFACLATPSCSLLYSLYAFSIIYIYILFIYIYILALLAERVRVPGRPRIFAGPSPRGRVVGARARDNKDLDSCRLIAKTSIIVMRIHKSNNIDSRNHIIVVITESRRGFRGLGAFRLYDSVSAWITEYCMALES